MSMQDPIADMLARIKNGQMAGLASVSMPSSKMKVAVVKVLQDEGYVSGFSVSDSAKPELTVELKYYQGKPVIEVLSRSSRPGLRNYAGSSEIPAVCGGLGVTIMSTSKGVITGKAAQEAGVGGEVICTVF